MSISEIFESSLDVIEGINFKLFAVALLYIEDIDDDDNIEHLEPIKILDKRIIRDFFQEELNKIIT